MMANDKTTRRTQVNQLTGGFIMRSPFQSRSADPAGDLVFFFVEQNVPFRNARCQGAFVDFAFASRDLEALNYQRNY
jgi:hypothetical protein